MSGKDHYYNKAKQQGYRARSAYKLKQLDREVDLLTDGMTVVDLGAAPGGWMQVAAEEVGARGRVVGVDLQRIDYLDGYDAEVETVKGDMTDEDTRDDIKRAAGPGGVDIVVSDMAPNMTGEYSLDHARSVYLARQAFETAQEVLKEGGHFVAKVFDGQDFRGFVDDVEEEFNYVRVMSPDASRESSSELYVVAKSKLDAPVSEGDVLDVEIVGEGDEGDGIAKVDGYTLFVSDASEGDEVTVEVEDVKPNFGFASVREE
ncbi:23S rRNA (uridine(2552)-2'-O)-methyltransferase [Halocalculus aciditolerans]|uniref:Ribosomal RNA large subunit methyltransferase E n=1 Tax=Halocalculus aciditolerans TaxID=1383812 RepID=A0A830FE50_9EURY|nr:23S rRNA (uridine(2552)-2'-O)-methyltransferase [Halocalculus aciditolerans]GGL46290.1 23S rRNA methyltransferase [Halocalculus aciditolerans]